MISLCVICGWEREEKQREREKRRIVEGGRGWGRQSEDGERTREKGEFIFSHHILSFSSKWSINQINAVYILKRVTILQQKSICAQPTSLHAESLVTLKLLASIHTQSAFIATLWSRCSLQTSVSPWIPSQPSLPGIPSRPSLPQSPWTVYMLGVVIEFPLVVLGCVDCTLLSSLSRAPAGWKISISPWLCNY